MFTYFALCWGAKSVLRSDDLKTLGRGNKFQAATLPTEVFKYFGIRKMAVRINLSYQAQQMDYFLGLIVPSADMVSLSAP
jgi:hypothetical protein